MDHNANQERPENVPHLQQTRPGFSISPQKRQIVVGKIVNTLRSRCRQPGFLSGVEGIAQKFEEKVFAIASDERDYLKRIASKMTTLMASSERFPDSSPAISASSVPNQPHPASSSNLQSQSVVPSENNKHIQQQVQSQNPSPPLINSNSTAMAPALQACRSHFTSQNSNLMSISTMPPNFERKAPEQLVPVSQYQSSNQYPYQGNVVLNVEKDSMSQQILRKQYSQQANRVVDGPTTQSEQPEVSSAYRHQSVTKQRYESWQRDIAHQRKSVPSQQKSILGKHEASREQPSTFRKQQEICQPSKVHSTVQQSMPENSAYKEGIKQENIQPHEVPLQTQTQRISQQKPEVVREEKNLSPGVGSMSQNLPRAGVGAGTIQSGSFPSEVSKRIDTSLAVERLGGAESWREEIHQRIIAMKKKYQTEMVVVNAKLDERIKLLDMHPSDPKRDIILKKLKDLKIMVVRICRFLNLPKDDIMPIHGEKLDLWEQQIVNYLNQVSRPKSAVPQSLPSLPPQTHTSQIRPTEEVRNVGLQLPTSISPSVDCNDAGKNLGNNSGVTISEQSKANLSPIERLLKAISSISPKALKSGVNDIFSVTCIGDLMESSAPRAMSKSTLLPLGQDLASMTGCRLQARNMSLHNGGTGDGVRTWAPSPQLVSSLPLHTSDIDSISENQLKRLRAESPHMLLSEEITELNQRLIDIFVEICKVDASRPGLVVKCCYMGISVDLGFMKSIIPSGNSSLIESLHLLIPKEYPESSPVLLDKLPTESGDGCEHLSNKARAMLEIYLRGLNHPFTVSDVVQEWELCARGVIIEYAEKFGGGTFSSKYGTWENCLDISM